MSANGPPRSPEYLAEDGSTPLLVTSIVFLAIETIFMTFLFLSRYFAKGERPNMWMEILMTLTYIVCVGKITIGFLLIEHGGAGRHLQALDPPAIKTALKLSFALQVVCPLTTSFSKLGALCLFHRIFGQASKTYRTCINATFGLVVAIMIAQILIPFLNCRPFNHTWNPRLQSSCTIPALSLWRFLGIPNVVTTLIIVSLPVPALAKLNISRPVRIGLIVVFSICLLGIVAAIMRFQSFLAVTDFRDITYENVRPLCWTIAESGIYLVAGIMPTLRPLLRRVFKDTVFERLLITSSNVKVSGSWGSRRFSRMRKDEKGRAADIQQNANISVTSAEGVALISTEPPKTNAPGPGWI